MTEIQQPQRAANGADSQQSRSTVGNHPRDRQRDLLTEAQLSRLDASHPLRAAQTADSPMLRALTGRASEHRPVWFMRQAGRSLPEYRKAREGIPMLDACLTPELAAEITVQPVRRHKVECRYFLLGYRYPHENSRAWMSILCPVAVRTTNIRAHA